MIPQTVLALVGFLFLVAPGLVFEIRRERRRPTLEETAFREASRTALASLSFTVVAVSILAAIRARWPWLMPDPGRWLDQPKTYVSEHYRLVAGFFVAELVLACALALGFERVLGWRQGATIRSVPIWYRVFRQELPKEEGKKYMPFVGVRLSDGTEYGGFVAGYSTEYPLADRELVLSPPLFRRFPDEPSPQPMTAGWRRLVIRGPEIREIWVSYREVDPPRPRRWRRILSCLSAIDLPAPFAWAPPKSRRPGSARDAPGLAQGVTLGQSRAYPSGRPMRISMVYSTGRTETGVLRMLDGERRSLVIMCPWGQAPVETLLKIHEQLTPEEKAEALAALGLPRANGA